MSRINQSGKVYVSKWFPQWPNGLKYFSSYFHAKTFSQDIFELLSNKTNKSFEKSDA